jgi:hypothetical protein
MPQIIEFLAMPLRRMEGAPITNCCLLIVTRYKERLEDLGFIDAEAAKGLGITRQQLHDIDNHLLSLTIIGVFILTKKL